MASRNNDPNKVKKEKRNNICGLFEDMLYINLDRFLIYI